MYSIFVTEDGTNFSLIAETGETATTFTGETGRSYGFFCVAKDTAGNVEDQALAAETTTTVTGVGQVAIDVDPFSSDNRIRAKSHVPILVAILGSEAVDVTKVDVTSLAFGPNGASPVLDLTNPIIYWLALRDVNDDGETDLVPTFLYGETGLPLGESQACLTGQIDGMPFEGCDTVVVFLRGGCGLGIELVLLLPPLVWISRRRKRRSYQ
jgi:hypothetical protein